MHGGREPQSYDWCCGDRRLNHGRRERLRRTVSRDRALLINGSGGVDDLKATTDYTTFARDKV